MKISSTLAQNIVSSIKSIINQELNFIDINGIIIASTDSNRIGQIHGGAIEVISTRKTISIKSDDEFTGAKKGINMPIYYNNEIIGVIGITGDPDEVTKYGYMLIHMTELLVKEAYLQEMAYEVKENQRIIIENLLIADDAYDFDDNIITDILAFDVHIPRRVVQGKFSGMEHLEQRVYNQIYNLIPNNKQSIFIINGRTLTLLLTVTEEKELISFLKMLSAELYRKRQLQIVFGIGSICTNKTEAKKSYKEAQDSLRYSNLFSHQEIQFYDQLDLGILLLPDLETKGIAFEHKILSSLNDLEKEEFLELLKVYEKHNGAITACANELFIHKNTLQYRLNNLHNKTGYNPRVLKDFVILKLAFVIYEMEKK